VTFAKLELKATTRGTPDFLRMTNVNKPSLQLTKIQYKQDDDISVPRNLTVTKHQKVNNLAEAFLYTESTTYSSATTLTKAFRNHFIYEAETSSQLRNTVFEAVCGLRFTEYLSTT
jgi:hypothetical protein